MDFAPALSYAGSAKLNGSRLRLTDGGHSEFGAVWYTTPVNVQSFTQDFSFQLTNAERRRYGVCHSECAEARRLSVPAVRVWVMAQPVRRDFPEYPTSVAIKFDLYNNYGEGQRLHRPVHGRGFSDRSCHRHDRQRRKSA